MRKEIFTKNLVLTGVIAIAGSISAYAGTTPYSAYDLTVPRLNQSAYTGYTQTKTVRGATGNIDSWTVGGNYTVDVRMLDAQGNAGAWARNVGDNTNKVLGGHNNHLKGDSMRAQFSSDLSTTVNVSIDGAWRSDN